MAAPTLETLEARVAALEAELAQIKRRSSEQATNPVPWWKERLGIFKDHPVYDEAMRLGREYRESLRPPDYEDE